jgi:hypothetical protein
MGEKEEDFLQKKKKPTLINLRNLPCSLSLHQFDLTFPHLPCSWLSLDAMDISGEVELDVDHDVYKRRLDPGGKPFTGETHKQAIGPKNKPAFSREEVLAHKEGCGSCYGASANASHCCATCDDVREAYKAKAWSLPDPQTVKQCHDEEYYASLRDQAAEGCHLWGVLRVARVAGNFHVAVGKSYTLGGAHYHDLAPIAGLDLDLQHTVAALQFGPPFPGRHSPLDGTAVSRDAARARGGKPGQVQYFLKVVPTSHTAGGRGGKTTWSSSYAVTEHVRAPTATAADPPGVFFFYEMSPLRVATTEARPPFLHFVTSVCAVVGGVWSLSSLVDAAVYRGARATRRKVDLGKTG